MIKFIFICIISSFIFSYSNKIAIDINGIAITDMDIKNISNKFNLSRDNSISKIIADTLYNQDFEKRYILVNKEEIDKYMKNIASSNNISLLKLQKNISKEMTISSFKKDIKQRIKKEKLIIQVLQEKKFFIDERALKAYYQDNKNIYAKYKNIKIKEYMSKNKNELYAIKKNPFIISRAQIKEKTINMQKISDIEIKNALISTNKNKFSNIINKNGVYIMFYIKSKKHNGYYSFKAVKNNIYAHLYENSKNKIINSYFARKKIQANIIYK